MTITFKTMFTPEKYLTHNPLKGFSRYIDRKFSIRLLVPTRCLVVVFVIPNYSMKKKPHKIYSSVSTNRRLFLCYRKVFVIFEQMEKITSVSSKCRIIVTIFLRNRPVSI